MTLVVIGPEAAELLPLISAADVSVFDSLETFDLWRKRAELDEASAGNIETDVHAVLADLDQAVDDLDHDLRRFFSALESRAAALSVNELVPDGISESTFYRRWRSSLPGTPKEFLARVRLRHAQRLMTDTGLPLKEVAWRAGFASTWHLRKALSVTCEKRLPLA
jgi:AraC-like DNA-binding protein